MADPVLLTSTVKIQLSKQKLLLLLSGAIMFVAAGLWFVANPHIKLLGNQPYPVFTALLGYTSVIFFGVCAGFIFKKLFDIKPGMVVAKEGILDNSSGISAGFIPWADVTGIYIIEVSRQKLIMIEVANPEDYINRQTNFLAKKAASLNYKMYKTPISISTNSLLYSFDELFALLKSRWEESTKDIKKL